MSPCCHYEVKRMLRSAFLLLGYVVLVPTSYAASSTKDPSESVEISGKRMKVDDIRKELVQLEDRFYNLYNAVNFVRDFDIHCSQEAHTGSHLTGKFCRAVYVDKALQQEGQDAAFLR